MNTTLSRNPSWILIGLLSIVLSVTRLMDCPGFAQDGDVGIEVIEPEDAFTDAPDADTAPAHSDGSNTPPSAETRKLTARANACRDVLLKVTADELYRFTPAVRAAYLDYVKAKTRADLAATGKIVPEEFFAWIDRTPDVEGSVYSARSNCANVVLMLYSLSLDLGREHFEKYRQLALAHAIVHESQGPRANITPRDPLKLVIPPCLLKPVNTKDPNRKLDTNDHIINFLNEHTLVDAKGTHSLTAANVMASKALQEDFNAYMKSNGCEVTINCGDHVIYPSRKAMVKGPEAKGILNAFKMFKAAYIAKGLLPAKPDPAPSPAESCLFLIRNDESTTPAKSKQKPPQCSLTAPWPILTFLAKDTRSLREQDDIWQRYHDKGKLQTYGEYIGHIAQQYDFQSARRLCPYPFAYNTVQMMLKDGGACGTMANIAVRTYKALGVPASTAGQPGHCALVYFMRDSKSHAYKCKGSQFVKSGPKDTNVLTPWLFGEKHERKKMVYHESIAYAMNHGFDSYIDSTMAWQLFRILPDEARQAHGLDLLESGLTLNPYNFLLADSGTKLAVTPEAQIHFGKSFTAALDLVTKPGCPKTGLYPETIQGRLRKVLAKSPMPADIVYATTMPGDASARQTGKDFTLSNNVLEMGWSLEEGHLLLTQVADKMKGRSYPQRSAVFEIQVDYATKISASACQLVGTPTLEIIKPVPASACTARRLSGWQLAARFKHEATGMTVQWHAELRNGSHYVRQVLRVEGPKGILSEVRCLEANVGRAWSEGTAMAGNPVCSDHLFMGQELPMSKNVAPGSGVADQWSQADMQVKAINRMLKDLKPGPLSVQFTYERGVYRIDVAEVQLLADGKVLSKDEHAGWSGLQTHANIYTLTVPEGVTKAELLVRLGGGASETDSFGKITVGNGVLELGRPGPVLCGLSCKLPLQAGKVYEFSSVLGTYPEGQLRRAFLRYVERERARPYTPFLHYNCWFDLHINLNEQAILKNIKAFTEEMTVKRGVEMQSYVLDDGWDNPLEGFWTIDKKKFPSGFDPITAELDRVHSHLGIWISPLAGYAFIGERVEHARKLGLLGAGFLDLSDVKYYKWFRDFCANLVKKNKVNYFKWDKAGDGASPHFMALLSCARELRQVDPSLFFNVTVGTWPSPFWLNVIDSTWRGGEDVNWDWQCKGNDREKWLNYRDGVTYRGVVKVAPLYPLNSIMTHGIVHAALGAAGRASGSGSDLRNEARSYFGSGTALQELYIQPSIMTPSAWDAVAEAAKWAHQNTDVLVDTHWVGGDPLKHEIYGWASWTPKKAILILRNPDDKPHEITLDASVAFELPAGAAKGFTMTSPYTDQRVQKVDMTAGKPNVFSLQPFEVLVLESKTTNGKER